ncbi:MAG: outer membrane beta-barrel protein [Desulfobulbaceae bacterium]|nr:outer membrane beta-barrel protein [Desulfobulbaceae bacterium]
MQQCKKWSSNILCQLLPGQPERFGACYGNGPFYLQVALFVLILSGAVSALADGKMVVKPLLITGLAYESNYFLTEEDEREVSTFYIRPGIEFGYTTAKSNLLFNYLLDANWYDEKGDPPAGEIGIDDYDYVGHDMEASADTQLTDRLKIGIEDTYILTRDPDELDYYSNEIIRQKYAKNILKPHLLYQFGEKFSLASSYANTDINYKDDLNEDSKENRVDFTLHYTLTKLNSLDVKYQYWQKEYNGNTPDYDSNQAYITFNRELKYYTISASGGYHRRSFDSGLQQDTDNFIWSLSLKGSRPQMLFSLSQNYNDTAVNNDYYLATRFTAAIGHLFLQKLNVKLKAHYQYSDYLDNVDDREDKSWDISCKLDYLRNEYLSFFLQPGYGARDSSLSGNDYDNTYILAGIQVNYDFGAK